MDFLKKNPYPLAAYCFAGYSVLRLFNIAGFWNILSLLAYVFLTVVLFMKRRDILLVIASAVPALLSLVNVLRGGTSFLGLLGLVADLAIPAFVASFLLPQLEPYVGKYMDKLKKFWYVPAAAGAAIWVLIMFRNFFLHVSHGSFEAFFYTYSLTTLLSTALLVGGELLLCSYMVFPEGLPEAWFSSEAPKAEPVYNAATGEYEQPAPAAAPMELNLILHILLLVFAGWIWIYIWIFRTTKALNNVPGEKYRNPVTKLLLCMFIPFYYIYWTYKSAQRIDKLAALNGIPSDIGTLCLILSIFVGIVPPIIMQEKLNTIATSNPGSYGAVSYGSEPDYSYSAPARDTDSDDYSYEGKEKSEPIPLEAPAQAPELPAPAAAPELPAPQLTASGDDDLDDKKSMKKYI